MSTRG